MFKAHIAQGTITLEQPVWETFKETIVLYKTEERAQKAVLRNLMNFQNMLKDLEEKNTRTNSEIAYLKDLKLMLNWRNEHLLHFYQEKHQDDVIIPREKDYIYA